MVGAVLQQPHRQELAAIEIIHSLNEQQSALQKELEITKLLELNCLSKLEEERKRNVVLESGAAKLKEQLVKETGQHAAAVRKWLLDAERKVADGRIKVDEAAEAAAAVQLAVAEERQEWVQREAEFTQRLQLSDQRHATELQALRTDLVERHAGLYDNSIRQQQQQQQQQQRYRQESEAAAVACQASLDRQQQHIGALEQQVAALTSMTVHNVDSGADETQPGNVKQVVADRARLQGAASTAAAAASRIAGGRAIKKIKLERDDANQQAAAASDDAAAAHAAHEGALEEVDYQQGENQTMINFSNEKMDAIDRLVTLAKTAGCDPEAIRAAAKGRPS